MKETSSTASTVPVQVPAWLLLGPAAAAAAILGFGASGSLLVIAAVLAGSLALLGFAAIRLSVPVKLIFLLITVTFLQRLLGYFKLGEVRGLNAGNLLLLAAVGYWFLRGVSRGALYRPTPLDFWLGLTAVAIPLLSIAYTVSVRRVPGYSLMAQLAWYKQWVTPFVYLFLLCQCLETRKEVRRLFYLVLFLVGLAVLQGLPEALRITTLHVERARGIVGQANDYAGLLATTAPFPLLILFLLRGRPAVRVLALGLVGCLALCLLSTYSRAGYIGFGISLAGAAWVAYRGTRRLAVAGPLVLVGALCLVPFAVAPQLIESVQSRFETDTYKRAKRKSYSKLSELNQFSGNRLEIWKGALKMAEANPVFGVGFHAFEAELPKYWNQKYSNYPHNLFLGALAEGGVIWLTAILVFLGSLLRVLYQHWRATLAEGDVTGQIICGGAVLSLVVMIAFGLANDFLNPGPKGTIFWVVMAGALKYGLLPHEDEPPAGPAGAATAAAQSR